VQDYGMAWSVAGVPEPGAIILFLTGGVVILCRLGPRAFSSWRNGA